MKQSRKVSFRPSIQLDPKALKLLTIFYQQVEVYLQESRKLLKYSQYRKCVLTMDTQLWKLEPEPCPLQVRIQLCRRLLYCTQKILKQYIYNYQELPSKQPMRLIRRAIEYFRMFQMCLEQAKYIDIKEPGFLTANRGHTVQANNKRLVRFYTKEFLRLLFLYTVIIAEYYKRLSLDARAALRLLQYSCGVLNKIEKSCPIENMELLFVFFGSFYFNLQDYNNAEVLYLRALSIVQFQLGHILDADTDMVALKSKVGAFRHFSQISVILYVVSYIYEHKRQYERALEGIKVASWIHETYLQHGTSELSEHIEQRRSRLESYYTKHIANEKDIRLTLNKLLSIQSNNIISHLELSDRHLYQSCNQDMYDQFHVQELNKKSFIRVKSFEQKPISDSIKPFVGLSFMSDLELAAIDNSRPQRTQQSELNTAKSVQSGFQFPSEDQIQFSTRIHTNAHQLGSSTSHRQLTESSTSARKFMKTDQCYLSPSPSDADWERRLQTESTPGPTNAMQNTYMKMISARFAPSELQSHRQLFETRVKSSEAIDKVFKQDLGFALNETRFRKSTHHDKEDSQYNQVLLRKDFRDRELVNSLHVQLSDTHLRGPKRSLSKQASQKTSAIAKFKHILFTHSKTLGLGKLQEEIQLATQPRQTSPREVLPAETLLAKLRDKNANVTKMFLEEYEQKSKPAKQLKLMLQPGFVGQHMDLAKSTSLVKRQKPKATSISEVVRLSMQRK